MKRSVLSILVFLVLSSLGHGQNATRAFPILYARMSTQFHQRDPEGIMAFIADDFQSDQGWNKRQLQFALTQLMSGYQELLFQTDYIKVTISTTGVNARVEWKGRWLGKVLNSPDSTKNGDTRVEFPYFGSQYLPPDSNEFQIHDWVKKGSIWRLSKAYTPPIQNQEVLHNRLKKKVEDFPKATGEFGLAYGRNILNSVDTNGILFIAGESPLIAIIYLKEYLHERPDITVYDRGLWYPDLPAMKTFKPSPISHSPQMYQRAELMLLKETNKPVFSIVPRQYNDLNIKDSQDYVSVPHGMVFEIISKTNISQNSPSVLLSNLTDLDNLFPRQSNHLQRELSSNYHFSLAINSQSAGQKDKALQEFREAAEIGYDVAGIPLNVGSVMAGSYGLSSEAMNIVNQETIYNPWFQQVYLPLARLQEQANSPQSAISSYLASILWNPNDINSHLKLGELYYQEGRFENAKTHYLQFLKDAPFHQDAYLKLGEIFEKTKQPGLALKQYKAYLNFPARPLDPTRKQIELKVKELEKKTTDKANNEKKGTSAIIPKKK